MPLSNKKSDKDSWYVTFGIYGALGVQLSVAVVVFLWLGNWADRHWGTTPWLTLLGLILGCGGGMYNFLRIVNWYQKGKK